MRTAENQRIDPLLAQRSQITLRNHAGDRVVPVDKAAFHQRNEKGAALFKNLSGRVDSADFTPIGAACNGGRGANDADPAAARKLGGRMGGGDYNAGKRKRERVPKVCRSGAYGSAGGDNHFYIIILQKTHILRGIFTNYFAAARTVGDTTGIAEKDNMFMRQPAAQLADGG